MILPDSGRAAGIFASVHRRKLDVRKEGGKRMFFGYLKGGDSNSISSLAFRTGVDLGPQGENFLATRSSDAEKAFIIVVDCLDNLQDKALSQSLSFAGELVRLRPQSANAHLLLAALADAKPGNDKKSVELAESSYKEALKLAGQSVAAHANYGCFLFSEKREDEALVEFNKAVEIESDNAFVLLYLVEILQDRDADKAEVFARRLVEKYPDKADYWFKLSTVLGKTGKGEEEVETARKAVSLNEEVPYQHRRRLADALKKVEKLDEAEQCYKLLLEEHQCARCWFAYAELLSRSGAERYAAAVAAIEKAESMNDGKLILRKNLSELRHKLCKPQKPEESKPAP